MRKSALAIVLLLGIAALGMYKPGGLTAYGRRKLQELLVVSERADHETPLGVKVFYVAAGLLVLVIVVLHLTGHSMGGHHQ